MSLYISHYCFVSVVVVVVVVVGFMCVVFGLYLLLQKQIKYNVDLCL